MELAEVKKADPAKTKGETKAEDEIEVVSDEPEVVVETKPEPKAAKEAAPIKEESAEDGIKALKEQIAAERAAREQAERSARSQVDRANLGRQDSELQVINTAIDNEKMQTAALKGQLSAAWKAGDFDKASDLQEQISLAAARRMTLENGKLALESRLEQARKAPPSPIGDQERLERAVQSVSATAPSSAAWLRAHPDFVLNAAKNNAMISAHYDAVSKGLAPDSDAYFDSIETKLGLKQPAKREITEETEDDVMSDAGKPAVRRSAPPAAPSSRVSGSMNGKNVVRLTAEEREAAEMFGMTPEAYAKQKLAIERERKTH